MNWRRREKRILASYVAAAIFIIAFIFATWIGWL